MLAAAVSRARRICCPALCAPVAKVPDVMALRAGLGFVARFRPAAGAGKEILRGLHLPFELVPVAAHHHQRVGEIDGMIGPESELAAGPQPRRDPAERAVVLHPPLRVPRLGPGLGRERIGNGKTPRWGAPAHRTPTSRERKY